MACYQCRARGDLCEEHAQNASDIAEQRADERAQGDGGDYDPGIDWNWVPGTAY